MKKILVGILVVILVVLSIRCGNNNTEDKSVRDGDAYSSNDQVYTMSNDSNEADMDKFGGIEFTEEMAEASLAVTTTLGTQSPEALRKIIKSANMDIETLEYELAIQKLQDKIISMGGYIESSNVNGKSIEDRYRTRSAYFIIRIPELKFEDFMADMNTIGNIINKITYGEDITSSYFDTEARLKTLVVQEERLLEILKSADVIEDIIELERALSNVRYEIESFTGTVRRWDNLISFATLNVNIYEVIEFTETEEPAKTLGQKISNQFNDTIESIREFFEDTLISGVGATPYLIFILPGLLIIILIIRKIKKGYHSEEVEEVSIEENNEN